MGFRLLNCRRYPGWGPLRHAGGTLPDQTGSYLHKIPLKANSTTSHNILMSWTFSFSRSHFVFKKPGRENHIPRSSKRL